MGQVNREPGCFEAPPLVRRQAGGRSHRRLRLPEPQEHTARVHVFGRRVTLRFPQACVRRRAPCLRPTAFAARDSIVLQT